MSTMFHVTKGRKQQDVCEAEVGRHCYRDRVGGREPRRSRKADAQRWEVDQKARIRTGDWTVGTLHGQPQSVFEDWLPANISDRTGRTTKRVGRLHRRQWRAGNCGECSPPM